MSNVTITYTGPYTSVRVEGIGLVRDVPQSLPDHIVARIVGKDKEGNFNQTEVFKVEEKKEAPADAPRRKQTA